PGFVNLANTDPNHYGEEALLALKSQWGANLTETEPKIVIPHDGIDGILCPNPYGVLKSRARSARITSTTYEHLLDPHREFAHPGHNDSTLADRKNLIIVERLPPWE
ncbi:MAG: hypothetical protein AAB901_00230, partial [Patescibacteria group bacterium]